MNIIPFFVFYVHYYYASYALIIQASSAEGFAPTVLHYQMVAIQVMKGQYFTVPVVAVDHVNHTVLAKVRSYLSHKESRLSRGQKLQATSLVCTRLDFRVYSKLDRELLTLYSMGPCNDAGVSQRQIEIKFLPCKCAVGFQPLESESTKCKCGCDSQLRRYISKCDPQTSLILRMGDFWITSLSNTSNNYSYFVFPHCPFDYCQPPSKIININLNIPNGTDAQCAYNRMGLLCGTCQPGFSVSLGSSRCIPCYKYWPALFVLITVSACIAGLVLVLVLLALNLTVASGTLNGIIFYANILAANKSILPSSKSSFVTVLLSWLNLDIGYDICYYEGMDTFTKSWIMFIFPIYVTLLVGMIILFSKYSTKFSSLIGKRNPVSTLATLILLSYAKLLQGTILAMSFAVLKYPSGSSEVVWRPDASVKYVRGKHFALFLVAILFLVLGVAYTAVLFSWQWLLRLSHMYPFRWVRNTKLNSFMDAYHAPYTPKQRYWTGLLLVARILLYLVSAVNVSGEPSVTLLATIVVVSTLFVLKYNVYKLWIIDVLESGLYVNLIILCGVKLYLLHSGGDYAAPSYVSTAIVTIILLCVIVYHLIVSVPLPVKRWIKRRFSWMKKPQFITNDLTTPFLDTDSSLAAVFLPRPGMTYSVVAVAEHSQ